jgi:hypothetical protein
MSSAVVRSAVPLASVSRASIRRRLAAVLRHEAFHAGPGLDQSAVDREVLTREDRLASFATDRVKASRLVHFRSKRLKN